MFRPKKVVKKISSAEKIPSSKPGTSSSTDVVVFSHQDQLQELYNFQPINENAWEEAFVPFDWKDVIKIFYSACMEKCEILSRNATAENKEKTEKLKDCVISHMKVISKYYMNGERVCDYNFFLSALNQLATFFEPKNSKLTVYELFSRHGCKRGMRIGKREHVWIFGDLKTTMIQSQANNFQAYSIEASPCDLSTLKPFCMTNKRIFFNLNLRKTAQDRYRTSHAEEVWSLKSPSPCLFLVSPAIKQDKNQIIVKMYEAITLSCPIRATANTFIENRKIPPNLAKALFGEDNLNEVSLPIMDMSSALLEMDENEDVVEDVLALNTNELSEEEEEEEYEDEVEEPIEKKIKLSM